MTLDEYRKQVNRKLAELEASRVRCRMEDDVRTLAQSKVEASLQAQELAQQVAQQVQQKAHKQIAGIVTRSLAAVFDDPYEFVIHFEQKRGRTEARMAFVRDGKERDPMDDSGGGVVDVAAFALRLSCLLLSRPGLARVMIMDEPFRFVSAGLRGRVRALLEVLSKEMHVQFIMVTHQDELKTGTVIELG